MDKNFKIIKSWKDIASYLGVGIRTAQRWTRERGLPVKQPGATRRTAVLAISDEIDQWLLEASIRRPNREVEPPELTASIATNLLWSRPSRPRQPEREVEVLLELARLMAGHDQSTVLATIATNALGLCKAESAGFSILETAEDGKEIFRWTATCGRMQQFEGGTTPADFSPCGFCLEANSPQLFVHPERHYSYLRPISPLAELLLVPMHVGNDWLGTVWVMCHLKRRRFDGEDVRLVTELGDLASAIIVRRWERRPTS
jgi:hypothetical protein